MATQVEQPSTPGYFNGTSVRPPLQSPSVFSATTADGLKHAFFTYPTAKAMPTQVMPSVGSQAPRFSTKAVIEGRIKDLSLDKYLNESEWLILIFIPMAWSFICPTEIRAFSRRHQEFETRTASVAFCSTDSEFVLRAWSSTLEEEGGLGNVHVPLLSDRSHKISREFGVLIEDEGVAQRAMFLIDPRGIIRHATIHDANVGRSVDEARRLLDALVFTDEFGEGCPVDWKKGDSGLKMGGGSTPTHGSSAAAKPRRPQHNRTSTWSGWLGRARAGSLSKQTQQASQQQPPQQQGPQPSPFPVQPQQTEAQQTQQVQAQQSAKQQYFRPVTLEHIQPSSATPTIASQLGSPMSSIRYSGMQHEFQPLSPVVHESDTTATAQNMAAANANGELNISRLSPKLQE